MSLFEDGPNYSREGDLWVREEGYGEPAYGTVLLGFGMILWSIVTAIARLFVRKEDRK
jgi:hypothetical protein